MLDVVAPVRLVSFMLHLLSKSTNSQEDVIAPVTNEVNTPAAPCSARSLVYHSQPANAL